MPKFLTDENIDRRITQGVLRRMSSGRFEVVSTADVGLERTPDVAILEWAGEGGYVVITHDKETMIALPVQELRKGCRRQAS
jgi:predicted nuclease of predicted toxin-antitoxin system